MNDTAIVSASKLIQQAIPLHQAGKLKEAESLYQQAIQLAPQHPDANHLLGLLAHQSGQSDKAVQLISNAIAIAPDNPTFHNNLGITYQKQGKSDEAEQHFQQAVTLKPDYVEALVNLGNVHKQKGQRPEAMKCYSAALKSNRSYVPAHFNMGVIHQEKGELDQAIIRYQQAVNLNPKHAEAYGNLGNVLKILGRFDEAVTCYQRSLAAKPDLPHNNSNYGVVLKYLGRLDEAVQAHRKAIALMPEYAEGHNNLANCLKEQGKIEEAHHHYREALQLLKASAVSQLVPKPRSPMDVTKAHQALLSFKSAMDEADIPFFLAYGTLLGVMRDDALLPHDKDMDVGLAWDAPRDQIIEQLQACGFTKESVTAEADEKAQWSLTFQQKESGISIDLFFFKPEGNTLLSGLYHKPVPLLWRFSKFETETLDFLETDWQVPSPPIRYLEEIYGPHWRAPDPYFDSLISGHNRTAESLDVALCYVYNRLFDRISRGEWAKAEGYCRQIETQKPDPFIASLQQWVRAQASNMAQPA